MKSNLVVSRCHGSAIGCTALVGFVCSLWIANCVHLVHASDDRPETRSRVTQSEVTESPGPDAISPSLTDPAFSLRGRSTRELWRDREVHREAVLSAARSDELETAERARWILDRWRRGILVSTPPALAKQLSSVSPVEAIELLLETSHFEAASIAMEEAFGTLEFETISARVAMTLDTRFPIYARNAIRQHREIELLRFLDLASITKELTVCRRDWAVLIGRPDEAQKLPTASKLWDDELRSQTLCLLSLLDGDAKTALQIAISAGPQNNENQNENKSQEDTSELAPPRRLSDSPNLMEVISAQQQPLVRVVQMLTSQWRQMATTATATAAKFQNAVRNAADEKSADPRSMLFLSEAIQHWSDALIASKRCDDEALQLRAIENLRYPNPVNDRYKNLPPEVKALAWRTLLIHGEIDAAIEWLRTIDRGEAALVLSAASRSVDAMEVLGYDAHQIDGLLESWIDDAIEAQRELHDAMTSPDPLRVAEATGNLDTGVAVKLDSMLTMMRLLITVGRDDAAWRIADRLSLADLEIRRGGRGGNYKVRDFVLLSLLMTNQTDWMIELSWRDWETEPSLISQSLISRAMALDDYRMLTVLAQFAGSISPTASKREAFQTACQIARADDSDRSRHHELINELAVSLRSGHLQKEVTATEDVAMFFYPTTQVWSDLFLAHRRPDLAQPILQRRSSAGDLKAMLELAKNVHSQPGAARRDETLESIWETVSSAAPQSSYRDDVLIAINAVTEQLKISRRQGDDAVVEELIYELRGMACTPSTDTRQKIADLMDNLEQWQFATEIYRSLLLVTALNSDETQAMIDIARNYQGFVVRATTYDVDATPSAMDTDSLNELTDDDRRLRREAVERFDVAFAGALSGLDYRAPLYLIYPRLIARERLELMLVGNQPPPREKVVQMLGDLQRLDPMDITTAESVLPKLRRWTMTEIADDVIAKIVQTAQRHADVFPGDSMVANNVAWGAAMNGFELQTALEMSRRAVAAEPESAIYRDTLAEILYRLDRPDEALQIEQGCIIDDPGQWHLHEQIERFGQKRR